VTIFVGLFVWIWHLGGTDEAAACRFVDAAHSYGAMYQRIDCGLYANWLLGAYTNRLAAE
jgi:hypothetical protein